MASTIPYLSTALCPVFVANPHARSKATDALVEPLHAHVYLNRLQQIPLAFEFSMLRTADTIEALVFYTQFTGMGSPTQNAILYAARKFECK